MESQDEISADHKGVFEDSLYQLQHGVPREHLINLSNQTTTNAYVSLFLIMITVGILYAYVPGFWLALWGTTHSGLFITLLIRNKKQTTRSSSTPDITLSKKGLHHAMVWAFVSASFWGMLTLFIPYSPTFVQFGLVLLMGGMAAGASTTLGSITLVSSLYILTCTLPVIIYFATGGSIESVSIALMLGTFTTAMLITTRIVNKALTQRLKAEAKSEKYRKANFQDKIISIINNESDSDRALELCLEEICQRMGWPIGHVYWVTDQQKNRISSSSIWYINNMNLFRPFKRITENTDINKKSGFLSRVLLRRKPIWIENLSKDHGFVRRSVAQATGIKSGFAFPVFINNKTVALIELYNTELTPVDKELLELIEPIGIQIGRAIERHSNTQSLLESETRFRALVRNSGQGIIVHQDGKPLFVNEEIMRIFGFSISQFLRMSSIYSLVAPEDQQKLREYDKNININSNNHAGLEYTALDSKGNSIPLMVRSSIISWDGNDAVLSTIIDLTTLKKTEMKLQQKQKMEAVGKLTGGIAHDFNNILMAISGNLELIQSKVGDDKSLSRWIEIARHGADRGSDLTKQLLLFSKQREMRPQSISVSDAINNLSLLTSNTLPSNINCHYEVPSDLPLISVDPSEFDSAIINLIVNSRDAMPNGGQLKIDAETITIDEHSDVSFDLKPGEYVALNVSDTGGGIPKNIEKRIFDPFFSNKEHGKGYGLGLSSVLGFVQSSGGTIHLESKVGEGTTFTLYFPVSLHIKKSDSAEMTKSSDSAKANGETILIVEDDPSIRAVVIDFLNISGYKTIGAVDGDNALKVISKTDNIDLLISDIMMPGSLSGIELVSQYLAEDPSRKAILMTGYSGDQVVNTAKIPENVIVLRKPFHKNKLFEAIQSTLMQS